MVNEYVSEDSVCLPGLYTEAKFYTLIAALLDLPRISEQENCKSNIWRCCNVNSQTYILLR